MRRLSTFQHRILRIAAIATAALLPAVVRAQLTVSGSSAGCFGAGCSAFTSDATLGSTGISFSNGSFSTTLDDGADLDLVSLGSLRLVDDRQNGVADGVFRLRLTFTSPSTAPQTVFTADVDGTYRAGAFGNDEASIAFGGAQTVSYVGGSFQLWVQDVQLSNSFRSGADVDPIAARIYGLQTAGGPANVVPEPSTYALLGTGIAALGMTARRRRPA